MAEKINLTERDIEVLEELLGACDNLIDCGTDGWVQPMDCGGMDGSDHSYRLSKLSRTPYAEARQRGGHSRGSKSYRITSEGRAMLSARSSSMRSGE